MIPTREIPHPPPVTDPEGNVEVDVETVINPKVEELGKPIWRIEDIPAPEPDVPVHTMATKIAKAVTEQSHEKREELKEAYGPVPVSPGSTPRTPASTSPVQPELTARSVLSTSGCQLLVSESQASWSLAVSTSRSTARTLVRAAGI